MVAPSSLLYWTSSPSSSSTATTTTTSMEKPCFNGAGGSGEQEMRRTTTSRGGSSRNIKSGKVLAKKPPQRGLGVAQLERLRIQERWKKITDQSSDAGITTTQSSHQLINNQFPHLLHQFPFQEQQNLVSSSSVSVPMIAAAGFSFQEQQICNLSSPPPQQPPPINFVFNPYRSSGCGSSGVRSLYSDQFQASGNHYQQQNNPSAASTELSSSQKSSHCLYDKCDVCLKKKRMNNGEILGFEGGAAAQYLERKSFVDGSDHFLGLDLGRNWTTTVNGGNQIRRSSGITTATINEDQEEVEVMAIHRKGKTGGGGGGGGSSSSSTSTTTVLMEYDFFPRKGASGRSSRSVIKKEPADSSLFGGDNHGADSSLLLVGESSSSSATTNLQLDLSLKLSC